MLVVLQYILHGLLYGHYGKISNPFCAAYLQASSYKPTPNVNRAGDTMSLFGHKPEHILHDPRVIWLQCDRQKRQQITKSMLTAQETGRPWRAEWTISLGDHCVQTVSGQAVITEEYDDGGLVWTGIFRCHPKKPDLPAITKDILNALPGFIYRFRYTADGQSLFDYVSPGVKNVFGCTDRELMSDGNISWQIIHPDDREGIAQKMQTNIDELAPWCYEWRICPPGQDTRWIKSQCHEPQQLRDGSYVWDGFIFDVSKEHMLSEIVDTVPGLLYRYRHYPDGRCYFDYVSEGATDILGCTPEDLYRNAQILWNQILDEDAHDALLRFNKNRLDCSAWCDSWRITTPDGQIKWIKNVSSYPTALTDGGVQWSGIITDTSYEKQLETSLNNQSDELKLSEKTRAELFDLVPGIVFMSQHYPDGRSTLIHVSEEMERVVGVPRDALLEDANLFMSYMHPEDKNKFLESVKRHFSFSKEQVITFRFLRNNQTTNWRTKTKLFSALPDGSIILIGVGMEITKELAQEEHSKMLEYEVINISAERQYLQDILKVVPGCVYMIKKTSDGCWTYPFMSYAAEPIFERSVEQLQKNAHLILEYSHPDDRQELSSKLNSAFQYNGMMHMVWRVITPKGSIKWIRGDSRPLRKDPDGTLLRVGFFVDVTKEHLLEQELLDTSEQLNKIIDAVPGGIYQVRISPDGLMTLVFASQRLLSLLGLPESSPLPESNSIWERIVEKDRKSQYAKIMQSVTSMEARCIRFSFYRFDNEKIINIEIHTQIDVIEDSEDKLLTGVAFDVTDKVEMESELLKQKIKAEEANVAKSTFLNNISHEMRTPLNGILGYAQLLSHELNLTGQAARNLSSLSQCSEHLLAVINEVLDMANIESGRLELALRPMALFRLLDEVESVIAPLARSKGLSFALHTSNDLPGYIMGDATRLRQILINLMSNALKYTCHGGFSLDVSTTDCNLLFSVSDTGSGIPQDKVNSIFRPFIRLDNHTSIEGTGLGLSICQRIVERLGGELSVTSQEGTGSCFTVTLPYVEADAIEHRSEPLEFELKPINQDDAPSILVVDDRQSNRDVMEQWLLLGGFKVCKAENGQVALNIVRKRDIDLILSDLRMPVMDGMQLIKELKGDPKLRNIPAVAISASVFPEQARKTLTSGFQAFLPKPCKIERLFDTIYKYPTNRFHILTA